MLITPHCVAGATLGKLVGRPLIAIPLAVASHYALDLVPHWQETLPPYTPHAGTWVRIPIDLALSLYLVHLIAPSAGPNGWTIWLAALGGAAPDLDALIPLIPQKRALCGPVAHYLQWHVAIQRETASLWGLAPQLALVCACLLLSRWRYTDA
jgi:hypothetical protein